MLAVADAVTRLCRQAIAVRKESNVAEKTYSTPDIAAWKMNSAATTIAVLREPNAVGLVENAARKAKPVAIILSVVQMIKNALTELVYK